MSAQPNSIWPAERHMTPMALKHVDLVMPVEAQAYEFPWSRGNFVDSLASGYPAGLLHDGRCTALSSSLGSPLGSLSGSLLGYYVAMVGVDEWHLLNITVAPAHQGNGHGRFLLDHVMSLCRAQGAAMLWLEVRLSNARARAIYRRYGFSEIGVRRGYYPAAQGREDAVVMRIATMPERT